LKNKNILIIILVVIIILLVMIKIFVNNKKDNNVETNYTYEIDDETGEYIISDDNGDEKIRTTDESVVELLKQDPDYDITISYDTHEDLTSDSEDETN
jgi:hypothetical protein